MLLERHAGDLVADLDSAHDLQPRRDFADIGVAAVEMAGILSEHEELTVVREVRVGAARKAHRAGLERLIARLRRHLAATEAGGRDIALGLIGPLDIVVLAPLPFGRRVAALDHPILHAMEDRAGEGAAARFVNEVLDGARGRRAIHLEGERAAVGQRDGRGRDGRRDLDALALHRLAATVAIARDQRHRAYHGGQRVPPVQRPTPLPDSHSCIPLCRT